MRLSSLFTTTVSMILQYRHTCKRAAQTIKSSGCMNSTDQNPNIWFDGETKTESGNGLVPPGAGNNTRTLPVLWPPILD